MCRVELNCVRYPSSTGSWYIASEIPVVSRGLCIPSDLIFQHTLAVLLGSYQPHTSKLVSLFDDVTLDDAL